MLSISHYVAVCLLIFIQKAAAFHPTVSEDASYPRCASHEFCESNEFCSQENPSSNSWGESLQKEKINGICSPCSQGCVEDKLFPTPNIFAQTCRELCPMEYECATHADCPQEGQWCSRDHKCHQCNSECGSYNRIHNIVNDKTSIDGSCPESCCDWGLRTKNIALENRKQLLSQENLHTYIGACDASSSFHAGILVLYEETQEGEYNNTTNVLGDDSAEDFGFEPEDFWLQDDDRGKLTSCFVMEHHFDVGYPRKVVEVDCSGAIEIACQEEAPHQVSQGDIAMRHPDAHETPNTAIEQTKTLTSTFVALLAKTGLPMELNGVTFAGEPFGIELDWDQSCPNEGFFSSSSTWPHNGGAFWSAFGLLIFCLLSSICSRKDERTAEGVLIPKAVLMVCADDEEPKNEVLENRSTELTERSDSERSTDVGVQRAWLFWGSLWSGEYDHGGIVEEEDEEDEEFV